MPGKRGRRWLAAVLVALGPVVPVGAQNIDPTSRENVLNQTGNADPAQLDSERKHLFARMIANPADLDIAFAYAALSVQLGDLEGAISTLERMLIFAPGLPRLQFELGVLYFRLGAFETAATYLRAVSAAPDVPAEIKSEVAVYLGEIDKRGQGSSFGGVITTGVRYQTNANAGPGSPFVTLNGLEFLLNPGALGQADANAFVAVNLGGSVDLENQGDRFDASLVAYGALYRNQTELNTGVIELRAGPTFSLQRFSIDNATLGVHAIASGAVVGGHPYLGALGAGLDLTAVLDAHSRVIVVVEGRHEEYLNSPLRPSASLGTGERYLASATYQYQVNANVGLFGTVSGQRRVAQRSYLSNWLAGLTVGAIVKFDSPIAALTEQWSIGLSGGVRAEFADAPDPVISPTVAERTQQVFVSGSLTVPLPKDFALQTSASYTVSKSNYDLRNYDNFSVTAAISKGF